MAFVKKVQVNCFLYFGVLVSIGEVHTAMHRVVNQDDEIYTFVYSKGLAFKRVGDARAGATLLVGRELFVQDSWTGIRLFTSAEGYTTVRSLNGALVNTKLGDLEEADVTRRLAQLGLVRTPAYILAHNYVEHDLSQLRR